MHLDDRTHRELLAGRIPPDEAALLARHLERGCELCEAFLAARPAADAADGRVERALAAVAERGAAGGDVEFAAIERRIAEAGQQGTRTQLPRPARRRAWSVAAAAAVVLAGGAALLLRGAERPGWDGTKGAASSAVPVRLRYVVVEGDAPLRQGASGERVSPRAALEFEVELGRAAEVALVRVPPDGAPEVFWRGRLGPGASSVALDGRPAAYRLEALGGRQRFVAVASDRALADDAAGRAAAAERGTDGAVPGGVETAAVEVRIE